jgi:hypothetical protein
MPAESARRASSVLKKENATHSHYHNIDRKIFAAFTQVQKMHRVSGADGSGDGQR